MEKEKKGVQYKGFRVTHRVFLYKKMIGYIIECENQILSGFYEREEFLNIMHETGQSINGRAHRLETLSLISYNDSYICPQGGEDKKLSEDYIEAQGLWYFDYKRVKRSAKDLISYLQKKIA